MLLAHLYIYLLCWPLVRGLFHGRPSSPPALLQKVPEGLQKSLKDNQLHAEPVGHVVEAASECGHVRIG